jgi:DNA-binding transcriptional MerR regulator
MPRALLPHSEIHDPHCLLDTVTYHCYNLIMNVEPSLTLDELCAQVALSLAVDYDGAPNDRIRDVPDRRTIRYYTTLGLLDRAQMRGRTALYGRRHLLQLVAIKRLQGHGLSLSEIQQRLLAIANSELEKIARLPSDKGNRRREPAGDSSPQRANFWKVVPEAAGPDARDKPEQEPEPIFSGLRLCADVLLMLPLARTPDHADLQALQAAAAPLLKLLETRRLRKT